MTQQEHQKLIHDLAKFYNIPWSPKELFKICFQLIDESLTMKTIEMFQ